MLTRSRLLPLSLILKPHVARISSTAAPKLSPILSVNAELTSKLPKPNGQLTGLGLGAREPQMVDRLAGDGNIRRARSVSTSTRGDSLRPYSPSNTSPQTAAGFNTFARQHADLIEISKVVRIPKPWEMQSPTPELPIRVPFLPDNYFAHYHRHEYVPEVALPIRPQIVCASAESTYISSPSAMTEVLDNNCIEFFGGETKQTNYQQFNSESNQSQQQQQQQKKKAGGGGGAQENPMTTDQKQALYAFSGASVLWYFMGGGSN